MAASTLSIAHPPGYPLLVLLGRFVVIIFPIKVAYALNIFSALMAAASVGAMSVILRSILFERSEKNDISKIMVSIAGSLIWGFSNILWASSAGFEVYSLGILLMTLTYAALLKFESSRDFLFLIISVYVLGLSLANHLSAISLAPLLLYYVIKTRPGPQRLSILSLFFLLAIALYVYLPVRSSNDPVLDWSHPATFGAFFDHISALRYQTYISGFGIANFTQNLWRSFKIIADQIPAYLLFLGMFAFFIPGILKRNIKFSLASILILNLLVSALYDIPDIDMYYLPSVFVLTICLAALLYRIMIRIVGKWSVVGTAILTLVVAVLSFYGNFAGNDQSENYLAEIYGENILKSTPENSILISVGDNANSTLYYLRYVEGKRPDLEIYDSVLSVERLKLKLRKLKMDVDLSGSDLCLSLMYRYSQNSYLVKEHMLARGNPYNYNKMKLYPRGLVYGLKETESSLEIWDDITIPPLEDLIDNIDFKGMTMLANLHLCYGEDLFKARQSRDAVNQYRQARSIAALTREASVHNSLGIFFRHEGWPVLAKNEYESGLEAGHVTNIEKANIYVNLGNLEKDGRKYDKAIELYLKALNINSKNKEAQYNIYLAKAYDYLKKRKYDLAVLNFENALKLPGPDMSIYFNLGVIYDKNLVSKSKAIYNYTKYIERYPDSDQAEAAQKRIVELQQ